MSDFKTSLRLFVLSLLVCSVVYPAVTLGFAALVAPAEREGSLIRNDEGTIVGSRLLAQNFTEANYFWPRPSACDYDASATGGSNLSPTNPKIAERTQRIIKHLQPDEKQLVPSDLVLASGGGMDPHITLSAVNFQIQRVATARNMSAQCLEELILEHIDSPTLVLFGAEPIVNVLELNLALDNLQQD
jgi:K+-transporting ATPase ATPase C chain